MKLLPWLLFGALLLLNAPNAYAQPTTLPLPALQPVHSIELDPCAEERALLVEVHQLMQRAKAGLMDRDANIEQLARENRRLRRALRWKQFVSTALGLTTAALAGLAAALILF